MCSKRPQCHKYPPQARAIAYSSPPKPPARIYPSQQVRPGAPPGSAVLVLRHHQRVLTPCIPVPGRGVSPRDLPGPGSDGGRVPLCGLGQIPSAGTELVDSRGAGSAWDAETGAKGYGAASKKKAAGPGAGEGLYGVIVYASRVGGE